MKRTFIFLLAFVLIFSIGCQPKTPAVAEKTAPPGPETFQVTVQNDSSYIFNELYVSPTAANEWGADHLGSTSILKSNGSFDITLEKYQFDNYDILIIDQDNDTYKFTYVPLTAGATVSISFNDGLIATVSSAGSEDKVVSGELESANSDGESVNSGNPVEANIYDQDFIFTIYNESPYEIYSIHMSPDSSTDDSVDVLPTTLSPGGSQDVSGNVAGTQYAGETNWYLFVTDTDGDVSLTNEAFDPWLVKYVNVYWENGGYTCEFVY